MSRAVSRRLRHVAHSAVRAAAERDGALRHFVVVRGQAHGEGFEQRVQGRKLRALDVPVRDLDLTVQVESVAEAGVERLGELPARLLGQSAGALVHEFLPLPGSVGRAARCVQA
jgi:hypothetical protein